MTNPEKAWFLKRQGKSNSEIARVLGYASAQSVANAIRSIYKGEAALFTSEDRQMLIALEVARLDDIQHAMWQQAMYGDPKSAVVALKAIVERIKLLQLNAVDADSNQNTVLVIGGKDLEYTERLQKILDADAS